jgi:membrane fusion protein (multidrug efflux system)
VMGGRDAVLASGLGGIVERVRVGEGDTVTEGQVLIQVDSEAYAAQRDQVEAQLRLATSDLERVRQLGDLATLQQVEQAETQVAVLQGQRRGVMSQLRQANVRAPFAGTIGQLDLEPGEFAAPGAGLVRIVQLDPVMIDLTVSDRDRAALNVGDIVSVRASGSGGVYQGVVEHIGPAADLRTRSFPVEVRVDNPDNVLLPGMIASVQVRSSVGEGALILPQDWVVTKLDGAGVFIDVDNVAQWRDLELGVVVRDQVVVLSGLEAGERIIMNGHRELADGDELLIVREGLCCDGGRAVFGGEL